MQVFMEWMQNNSRQHMLHIIIYYLFLMHAGGAMGLISCGHSISSHFEKVGFVDSMATGKQIISFGQIQ